MSDFACRNSPSRIFVNIGARHFAFARTIVNKIIYIYAQQSTPTDRYSWRIGPMKLDDATTNFDRGSCHGFFGLFPTWSILCPLLRYNWDIRFANYCLHSPLNSIFANNWDICFANYCLHSPLNSILVETGHRRRWRSE